jgi:hypothetical protein
LKCCRHKTVNLHWFILLFSVIFLYK